MVDEVEFDPSDSDVSVFVSHHPSQGDTARQLAHALSRQGIACSIAPDDISTGASSDVAIAERIDDCDALVLLFSAVADQSEQVRRELALADDIGVPILSLRLENVEPVHLRPWLTSSQSLDWTDRGDGLLVRLGEHIRRLSGAGLAIPAVPMAAEDHPMNVASRRNGVIAAVFTTLLVLGGIAYGIWSGLG